MVMNDTKIYHNIKRSPLRIEKNIIEEKKVLYYNYKEVLHKEKYKKLLIFRLCKLPPEIFPVSFS